MDVVMFEERAAHLEFSCGETRFDAEVQAAREQGYQRYEVMNEIRKRDFEREGHQGQPHYGQPQNGVSVVQP